jgi:hypothetical protein
MKNNSNQKTYIITYSVGGIAIRTTSVSNRRLISKYGRTVPIFAYISSVSSIESFTAVTTVFSTVTDTSVRVIQY